MPLLLRFPGQPPAPEPCPRRFPTLALRLLALRLLVPRLLALPLLCLLALCLNSCVTSYYDITDFHTVVVDAGHGGHDNGAITRGIRPVYLEKTLALDVALRVERRLRAAGFHTVLTRRGDYFVTLDQRAAIGNRPSKSVFLSIHFNDGRRRGAHGMEVYHNDRGTRRLAARVQHALASLPGGYNRGVKTARFRVLRKARGPALLVECGFLSNREEARRCATPAYREHLAARIAQAVIEQRQ